MMKTCPNCHAPLPSEPTKFCKSCGNSLKKKHGCLIGITIFLVIIVLGFAVLAFFVSGLFKPYDLGVDVNEEAFESAVTKIGYRDNRHEVTGSLKDYDIVFSGSHPVDTTWTSEEVSSFIGYNRPKAFPAEQVQVRINDDGTVDAAANLRVDYILDDILKGQYTKEDIAKHVPFISIIPDEVNVKVNFEGKVIDNQIQDTDIHSVSVMGISVPMTLIDNSSAMNFIEDSLTAYTESMNQESGANFERIEVVDGELVIKGIIPDQMEMIKK